MIIGHLPSGYIAAKLLIKKYWPTEHNTTAIKTACITGAIAPDFDMLYFYLVDNKQHHHHSYWPHYPIVWTTLICISALWSAKAKNKYWAKLLLLFSCCGFLHILLDSIVGDIWWGAPFIDKPFSLFTVPALYTPWWLNFILHWSFLFELVLVFWAIYLWKSTPRAK